MSDIDPKVGEVLRECGVGHEGAWKHKQSGKWIVSHWALELVAAFKGVTYDEPKFLVAERDAAAVLVTGRLGERAEWSVGEAVIGLNYTVSGKQAGYPFAMAEKRAKDRVILKLVSLHGVAYSDIEADDFGESAPPPAEQKAEQEEGNPFEEEKQLSPAEQKYKEIEAALTNAKTPAELQKIATDNKAHFDALHKKTQARLEAHYADCLAKLTSQKEAA